MAAPFKVWDCGSSLVETMGSNAAGTWLFFCCECCVLSGGDLCDGPISCPQQSYRVPVANECDQVQQ